MRRVVLCAVAVTASLLSLSAEACDKCSKKQSCCQQVVECKPAPVSCCQEERSSCFSLPKLSLPKLSLPKLNLFGCREEPVCCQPVAASCSAPAGHAAPAAAAPKKVEDAPAPPYEDKAPAPKAEEKAPAPKAEPKAPAPKAEDKAPAPKGAAA